MSWITGSSGSQRWDRSKNPWKAKDPQGSQIFLARPVKFRPKQPFPPQKKSQWSPAKGMNKEFLIPMGAAGRNPFENAVQEGLRAAHNYWDTRIPSRESREERDSLGARSPSGTAPKNSQSQRGRSCPERGDAFRAPQRGEGAGLIPKNKIPISCSVPPFVYPTKKPNKPQGKRAVAELGMPAGNAFWENRFCTRGRAWNFLGPWDLLGVFFWVPLT